MAKAVEEKVEQEVTTQEVTTQEVTTQEVTTQEVTVKEEKAPAVIGTDSPFAGLDLAEFGISAEDLEDLTGLDSLNASDITIPYATLYKKASATNKLGDLALPDGTVVNVLDGAGALDNVSILKVMNVRVMFPTPYSPKNSFRCRSIDGKTGAEGSEFAGRSCANCEFAKYPEEGGSSPCRDQRLLLCAREDGSLFHLQVHGVDIKEWKRFLSSQLMHLLPKVKNIFGAFKLSLSAKSVNTDYGPFPALQFTLDPKDPFVKPAVLGRNLQALKGYKEFEKESLEASAHRTQAEMAASGEVVAEQGQNSDLF